MAEIEHASNSALRGHVNARALMLAIAPVAAVVLVVILASIGAEIGWFRQEGTSRFAIDAKGPLASVGRGSLGKKGYLLEIAAGGTTAVAAWAQVPPGLAAFPLVRCDCVPRRVDADLNLLWRRADVPDKTFSARIEHELGETQLLDLSSNPNWTGEINGVALALRGYPGDVLLIRGLSAQEDTIANRIITELSDWASFRVWNGQSINLTIIGARERAVSPVLLVAAAIALGYLALSRRRPARFVATVGVITAILIGWVGLDMRWQLDLLSKLRSTTEQFGSGPIEQRWGRGPDSDIYLLANSVKRATHDPGQRIFVFGDEPYARGRAAYHLLPLIVHYDAVAGAIPNAKFLRAGDLIFLTWSRQVRYDKDGERLFWNGGSVKVKPIGYVHGNVVFRVVA